MSNLLKSMGGDFNLNSVLSVNMMMILGAYRFCIKNSAYQTLKRVTEYNWQSHNRIGNNPALQFVGNNADTIELEGVIYPQFKGGLRQVTLMRAEADLGTPLFLISGNGFAFGRWCILSVSETNTVFMKDGTARKIEFSLKLQKYGEDNIQGSSGIVKVLKDAI